MVERFVYTEDAGSSTLSTPTTLLFFHDTMLAMKFLIALVLLFIFQPAFAQNQAPEARPFAEGITSFKQAEEAQAKEKQAGGGKQAGDLKLRQPHVEISLPPEFQSSEQKWPLLIFSHGFGGCAKQSAFLTDYLAEKGYIVIAPDHADTRCDESAFGGRMLSGSRGGSRDWPEKPFRNPESWTDKTESDRKDDVLFALSSMLDDRQYAPYVDLDRMGLIGHSLGGYTMLGIAGAWPSWKDKRFKAVLAMSPFVGPYRVRKSLKNIDIPVMYQGGTKDTPITPELRRRGGSYDQTRAPKYFLEFKGAGHFSFTELDRGYQDIIRRTALDFMNKYVKGENVTIDEGKKPQVATFWKDEGEKSKE